MTMNNNSQEIKVTKYPPRSSIHKKVGYTDLAKEFLEEKIADPTSKKVTAVALAGMVGGAALLGTNLLTDNNAELVQAKTVNVVDATEDANKNNGQSSKDVTEKESDEEETEEVEEVTENVEEEKTETVKTSQNEEVKAETVKSAPKTETVTATATPKADKVVKVEKVEKPVIEANKEEVVKPSIKPSEEKSEPTTEQVVVKPSEEVIEPATEEVVEEDNSIEEEVEVEVEIEDTESQDSVETPSTDDVVADTDVEEDETPSDEEISEESSDEEVSTEVETFRGKFIGIGMDPHSHLTVALNGEVEKFCLAGNQEAWNLVDQLQSEDEIIIQYTEVDGEKVVSSIEKVEQEEEEGFEEIAINEAHAIYKGLADSGCIEVEVDGVTKNFYFYGNEDILATVGNLSVGAEILVQFTEGNQAVEVMVLEDARPAVNMYISNFCYSKAIEVIEDGQAKTYPLLSDEIRDQIDYLGANAHVSIVVKNGIEYVKLVEYVTNFAEGTFISHDEETATFSVGGELVTYKLGEDLQGKDLTWELGVGSLVNYEYVVTDSGSYLERIN